MQIPSNNIGIQQTIKVNTGPDRGVRDDSRSRQSDVVSTQTDTAAPEVDLAAELQRRVELTQAISDNRRTNTVDQNLPRNTQQALEAFENAKPSVEQQLGIEIVGIDTFA